MTYKENITAILECYFTGFKKEIIDSACNRILEQEPCDDCISRKALLEEIGNGIKAGNYEEGYEKYAHINDMDDIIECIKYADSVKAEPKMGHCKDCKWWEDSDGQYRRGVRAESKCPINTKTVYLGNGYCYKFEPKENEN